MAAKKNATVRGRRLRGELRRLREERGWSIDHVVELSENAWVNSTVSRWELGERLPRPADLRLLLEIYEVTDEERETLLRLAREARQRGWWHVHGDAVPEWFQGFVGLEAEASAVCSYTSEFVPGLLQTADYSRAIHQGSLRSLSDEEIERRVAVRMERQKLLERPHAPQLWFILNEAVIRRHVGGPGVMKKQLGHLAKAIDPPRITVQVLPYELGAHPGMDGAFSILSFPAAIDADLVYLEHQTSSLYVEEPDEVERYNVVFNHLRATALSTDHTSSMIREIVAQI
ncbi:helix-turn-helix domain-containing protein [Streptomonospora litoralis]|uniref:Helix-turn-helix protein n=1 Tax=Streptomonospora litoralis TaxID=2498135 RepID=A0A4P6Q9D9_9ACTN|nr:helix-turn-helix transcriptional regulator [Streptomonospora litoralis]QBI56211.1 Helix-turn-helix protein [Streptomonospora litoralis]